jgi:hypothetical protein
VPLAFQNVHLTLSTMLIKNYGLFWDREKVHWGKQNNSGSLKGFHNREKKREIEFRDQQGIYALYDAAFKLVYIGQTGSGDQRLLKRLNQHRNDHLSQRWKYFSWFGILRVLRTDSLSTTVDAAHVEIPDALNHLEAIAISISEPPLNLQSGRWTNSEGQYYQADTSHKSDRL